MICIFVTTTIFIGNLISSLLVLFMVLLSLVEVGGFMHFWGLTIDTVSSVNLIIAIGLCVDYRYLSFDFIGMAAMPIPL